jgi:hypothetical protein
VLFLLAAPGSLSCMLPSCCCLRAGGAGCWLVPSSTGALVLAFSALRASIWGSHIEAPYKKQQLKRRRCRLLYLWRAGGRRPASHALPAAAPCSLLAVLLLLLLQLLQLLLLLLKLLLLLLLSCCCCA